MNNTQKTTIATIVVGAVMIGAAKFYLTGSREASLARFPELDRKVAKKAYKNFMRGMMRGEYGGIGELTNEKCDELFLQEVAKLQTEK